MKKTKTPIAAYLALGVCCLATAACSAPAKSDKTAEFPVHGLIANGNLGTAKGWTLHDFRATGKFITRKKQHGSQGTATTPFLGPTGYYKIRIKYLDEGDGVSTVKLMVGKRLIGSWKFDGILVSSGRWKEFDGVKINKGDTISLTGRKGGYEYCRIYGVEISPSKPNAVPDATSIPAKDYSMNLVPVNPPAKFLLKPNSFFRGGAGTYQVYLKQGQTLHLRAWPGYASYNASIQCTLTKTGDKEPVYSKTLVSNGNLPLYLDVPVKQTGLYTLKAGPAPKAPSKKFHLVFDAPAVQSPPVGSGYFYVPKGTKVLGVKTKGHVVAMDDSGKVTLNKWLDKKEDVVVKVPAGSDGQVWSFQGPIYGLKGIPPYVSTWRAGVLAPAEVLK